MSAASPSRSQRFSEIDALRGIACGLVLWYHAIDAFSGIVPNKEWREWLTVGGHIRWLGVLIFFSISGFVIPSSLRGERGAGVKTFMIRRFWRLYPPFWCAVLVTWLIDPWEKTVGSIPWRVSMLPVSGWDKLAIGGHFWTLQVELLFYVLVGLLFFIFGRLGLRVLILAYLGSNSILWFWICFQWPYLVPQTQFWLGLPAYLTAMFWGACCRELVSNKSSVRESFISDRSWRVIGIGLVTGAFSTIPLAISFLGFWEGNTFMLGQGLSTFGGIIVFLFWGILTPLKIEWLARVGRWTYSAYLFHMAVIYFVFRAIRSRALSSFPCLQEGELWVYAALLLVLCFAVGAVTYRWIEQPSDRIGKRLTAKKSAPAG